MNYKENQTTLNAWADDTFGKLTHIDPLMERFHDEVDELQTAVHFDPPEKIVEEAADCVMMLYRIAGYYGLDIHEAIDKKMVVNREKEWVRDGFGNGKHVKDVKIEKIFNYLICGSMDLCRNIAMANLKWKPINLGAINEKGDAIKYITNVDELRGIKNVNIYVGLSVHFKDIEKLNLLADANNWKLINLS